MKGVFGDERERDKERGRDREIKRERKREVLLTSFVQTEKMSQFTNSVRLEPTYFIAFVIIS